MSKTSSRSLLNLVSKVSGAVITVSFIAYISRKISLPEMGIFAFLNISFAFLTLIFTMGMGTLVVRRMPEHVTRREIAAQKELISTALLVPVLCSVTVLLIYLGREWLALFFLKSEDYASYIALAAVYALINSYVDLMLLIYQGLNRFDRVGICFLANITLQRAFALVLFYNGMDIAGLYYGFIIGALVTFIGAVLSLKRYIHLSSIKLHLLKEAYPYSANGFVRYGFTQADHALVSIWFEPKILGIYFLARRMADCFRIVFDAVREPMNVALVQQYSKSKDAFLSAFKQTSLISFWISIFMNVPIIIFAQELLSLFGGAQYSPYSLILVYAALVNIGFSFYAMMNSFSFITMRPHLYLTCQIGLCVLSLFFQAILAAPFGVNGLQFGQLTSYALWSGLFFFLYYICWQREAYANSAV